MNQETGERLAETPAAKQPQGRPKDRDFIQTREGMFFCLTGYLHPPDRYTAYLKYSPDPEGKWSDGQTTYRRELAYYHVSTVAKAIRYLEASYPHYVADCPVRDIRFSMVPHDSVARYFRPRERLQEILARPQDSLEEEVCALLDYVTSRSGLPSTQFGLTGSLLTSSHNPAFSDIDLLVYGGTHAARLKEQLGAEGTGEFRRPSPEQLAHWSERVAQRHAISNEEATYLAQRRWNYRYFGERYVSIHSIRQDDEITGTYGDRVFRGVGAVRLRATLTDVSESLFLPAVYQVGDAQVLEGHPDAAGIREIVSYEGLFSDVADAGVEVEAYGKLETVNGLPQRLVIGTMQPANGYIKPLAGSGG